MLRIHQVVGQRLFLSMLGLTAFFVASLAFTNQASAASFNVSGTINDANGNSISGAGVDVIDTATNGNVAKTSN